MLSPETIQSIRNQVRIADVIGEFVALKKRGDSLIGLCPFHAEADPTLVVQPEKKLFFCTGCRKGGDAVRFLMEREHCSEEEALIWLAKRYGVALPEEAQGDEMYRLSDFAQHWFEDYMWHDEMGKAVGLSYFHGRGLSDDIIRRFGLGYCPEEWNAFGDAALKAGYSEQALVATGLCVKRDNGTLYDRFRGRVTFPIYSVSGRVLGFSCRILRSDKEIAKYVNSPESAIYDKGAILYGLFQARQAIQNQDKCYLVEGNVDVVAMHQSGVTNTVASCGTALTAHQVRLIRQYTQRVTVVYDGDHAGVKATLRAAELLFQQGMKVRMVLFPDNDDPDSYARKHGDEALRNYLENNEEDYIDYRCRIVGQELDRDPIRKAEVMKEMLRAVALVSDRIERDAYIVKMASRFRNNERTMQQEMAKILTDNAKKDFDTPPPDLFMPEEIEGDPQVSNAPRFQPSADEAQERKLISLLLNSGRELIEVPHEEGEPEMDYVAALIVSDITASELSFDNPLYHVIFEEYHEAIQHGEIPTPEHFINYPHTELRTTAISLMINPYHVSEKWAEKHVPVQDPSHHLKEDLVYSLLTFKLRKLDHQIEELDRQLRQCQEDEAMLMLVSQKNHLLKYRQQIANELNCVYN